MPSSKSLHLPYIVSIFLTAISIYFFNTKTSTSNKSNELIELYYVSNVLRILISGVLKDIAMQFAKVSSLVFNACFSAFFAYICYIGGYFVRFSKRSYIFHMWLSILTLLVIMFIVVFLLVTSTGQFTNIESFLCLNALQCVLAIGSLWEQRVRVRLTARLVI